MRSSAAARCEPRSELPSRRFELFGGRSEAARPVQAPCRWLFDSARESAILCTPHGDSLTTEATRVAALGAGLSPAWMQKHRKLPGKRIDSYSRVWYTVVATLRGRFRHPIGWQIYQPRPGGKPTGAKSGKPRRHCRLCFAAVSNGGFWSQGTLTVEE